MGRAVRAQGRRRARPRDRGGLAQAHGRPGRRPADGRELSPLPDLRVRIARAGGYDRLVLEPFRCAAPGAGEVRIRARAIGVNYADCVVRMGLYASARDYVGWPITPGFEVAGEVEAVGAGVERHRAGDAVIGLTRFGGYATRLNVPEHQVLARPPGFDDAQAAAFGCVHLTADHALTHLAHLGAGETVLVHSAAGGVGSALVRLAKLEGARVVGVVGRGEKVATARALGADAVIDKSTQPLEETARGHAPQGYDVVLDANGASTLRASYRLLRPTGRLVIYGFHSMLPRRGGRPSWTKLAIDWLRTPRFDPLRLTGDNKSVMGFNLSYLFERSDLLAAALARLTGQVEAGDLPPPEVRRFPFRDVADAHRALESGTTTGKLVLVP